MPTLKIPTPLRSYTGGQVEVRVGGSSVGEVMERLVQDYPPLKPHLFNGDGKLRPFVNLFVGEHNVKESRRPGDACHRRDTNSARTIDRGRIVMPARHCPD